MPSNARRLLAYLIFLLCSAVSARADEPIRIGFVGLHGGAFDTLIRFESAAGVKCSYLEDDRIGRGEVDFAALDSIVIQHIRDGKQLAAAIRDGKSKKPTLRVFTLSGSGDLVTHGVGEFIESDAKLSAFYRTPRAENLEKLLFLVSALVRGTPDPTGEPLPLELGVLRRPERDRPFDSVAELFDDARARGVDVEKAPRIAVVAHATHFLLQQPRVIAALIAELDARGALAFTAIDSEGREGDVYQAMMLEAAPDAVIHTCHSTEKVEFREALGAPHLHSMFFRNQSIAEWEASPQGLAPSEIIFHVATQEMLGGIEPIATCGTTKGGGSAEDFTPIPERISRLVGRALAHARLRATPNPTKKVAIVYYDHEASRSSLMRGSPTGMMLNAPPSILAVLHAMRDAGYRVDVPRDEDELIALAERSGRVVGVSGPGEPEALADSGLVPLVPVSEYEHWLEARVPAAARAELEKAWGPPPGRICVVVRNGTPSIVVPVIQRGNVVLLPQPLRGEAYDPSQTHDKAIPPPHSYLAAYFWLEREFGAHAIVHFGTHGSEFFLPGKTVGQKGTDWSDILIGDLPNFSPWVINNLGESILSKRRTYAVLVDHLVPPTEEAGLSDGLDVLHRDIERFLRVEPGVLREKMRATITAKIRELAIDEDLSLSLGESDLLDDAGIEDVCEYLHAIEEDLTPTSLHHLGVAPDDAARLPWLVHCGGQALLDALSGVPGIGPFDFESGDHQRGRARELALEILRLHLRDRLPLVDALRACGAPSDFTPSQQQIDAIDEVAAIDRGLAHTRDEIDHLLLGLDGRFVPPGPSQAPERNPKSVPTGRNMFLLDPREIPTKEAFEIGKQLVDDLIASHQAETGEFPTKVAFNIRATNSFRDFGVMEAQVLWMLGCEPVRDKRGSVIDVSVVPREVLGRPRIDVFLQGGSRYNDMLADRAKLLDRAVRLAIEQDEADNRVRAATLAREAELLGAGLPADRAAILAKARMFGTPPGGANASYSYLVQRSGDWQDRKELTDAYFAQERHAYTEGAWGEESEVAFKSALRDSQYVLRSWADTTRGPTTDKYQWMHGGTLALAVEAASDGRRPRFVLNDLRDMDRASLVEAEDALRRDFRVRALNRKWIEGMMKEGYAGADQLKVITSNAFGWQVMRSGAIPDSTFEQLADAYVRDSMKLGLKEFFDRENPWALQGIAENLLETARKGMWNASEATLADLSTALLESRAKHGVGGGFTTAGNAALEAYVAVHARPTTAAVTSIPVTRPSNPDSATMADLNGAAVAGSTVDSALAASSEHATADPRTTPPETVATNAEAAPPPPTATVADIVSPSQIEGVEMRREPAPAETNASAPPTDSAPTPQNLGALVVALAAVLLVLAGFLFRTGGLR